MALRAMIHQMVSARSSVAVYKTKSFTRFPRKAWISDRVLWDVANAVDQGYIDADLGGGVTKQRVARAGQGKSGGSRTIILLRHGHRAIFVFGFEKKDQANIAPRDLVLFQELAPLYLDASERQMAEWQKAGVLQRIEFVMDREKN